MISKNVIKIILVATITFFTPVSALYADENAVIKVEDCNVSKVAISTKFTELAKLAYQTRLDLCSASVQLGEEKKEKAFKEYAKITEKYVDNAKKIIEEDFDNTNLVPVINRQLDFLKGESSKRFKAFNSNTLTLRVTDDEIMVSALEDQSEVIPFSSDKECKKINRNAYVSCLDAVDDVANAFNPYGKDLTNDNLSKLQKRLEGLSSRWDNYLEESRSPTFVDLFATSRLYGRKLGGAEFAEPPSWQFFFMHPHVMYEQFFSGESGDKSKFGLGIEVVGVNYWEGIKVYDDFKVPIGLSVVATYADYTNRNSVGWGGMLTLFNKYSFGITWRKNKTTGHHNKALSVTIDMLKLFNDKKERLDAYKVRLNAYKETI